MLKPESRAAAGFAVQHTEGRAPVIAGYAAVFGVETNILDLYVERIARGAFLPAIGRDDVRALIDHTPTLVLGRTKSGTLRLAEDDKGLRVEIDPPDTQDARDLVTRMQRGDVNQMSFAFRAVRQSWDDSGSIPLRTIEEVELLDVSIVTYPAYPETEAAVRSLAAHRGATISTAIPSLQARMRMKSGLMARRIAQ